MAPAPPWGFTKWHAYSDFTPHKWLKILTNKVYVFFCFHVPLNPPNLKIYIFTKLFYSKHHAAERWWNFLRAVWKPNSKFHLSAAWCLLLTPRHEPLQIYLLITITSIPWNCLPKLWVSFQKFEWVFKFWVSFPKLRDFWVEYGINSEILKH